MNINQLMKQAREMQARMQEAQEKLASVTVEASSGGGKVTAVATGKQEIAEIRIAPEVVDPEDVEMLQDLVTAAVNEALRRAAEVAREEIGKATGGLGALPGML
ncbi:MAG: YbaB/EbfC family nucleoid-associated protein [Candidatus Latescibacterota bacterium]|nr:MAG: YbaB/EbfC family nucleoid-associated protein [Candidatus Latescibacterota bacterium]